MPKMSLRYKRLKKYEIPINVIISEQCYGILDRISSLALIALSVLDFPLVQFVLSDIRSEKAENI